ncbi:MAG TPA: cobyrinate a,c-diamide synthase [Leptolyngbyaceae cyanobacterium M65_K2018_010]|nr:cobyrinate a,c-diamide synthase [Leptolyngbyaceae cyanobacterium M65_K2018_010]
MATPLGGGLVIAGERSGVGKTTVTLALLAALRQRSQRVQSFKVGPDYIDPMFHRWVTGRPCYNLDPLLTSAPYVQQSFQNHCRDAEFALVEGVMGLFDGAAGDSEVGSTAQIAKLLQLPVLLVIDCSRLSRSVLAIVQGYRNFDPALTLAGVVLNRVGSDRHLELLKTALANLDLPILGVLQRQDAITIPSRHLGLVPTAELTQFQELVQRLAHLGQHSFDWSGLEAWLRVRPSTRALPPPQTRSAPRVNQRPTAIAIAQDAAFSFYYPDALDYLTDLGVELVPWSPLTDSQIPELASGLYLGGGFPEMFAAALADNQPLHHQIQTWVTRGMPTYAECGGLMYLAQSLVDLVGQSWPMVGILPTAVQMAPRLTLGYRRATAVLDSPFLRGGQSLWGHEFHRSETTGSSPQPIYQLQRYGVQVPHAQEGWQCYSVHASYVHVHWGGCPSLAQAFVQACRKFDRRAKP